MGRRIVFELAVLTAPLLKASAACASKDVLAPLSHAMLNFDFKRRYPRTRSYMRPCSHSIRQQTLVPRKRRVQTLPPHNSLCVCFRSLYPKTSVNNPKTEIAEATSGRSLFIASPKREAPRKTVSDLVSCLASQKNAAAFGDTALEPMHYAKQRSGPFQTCSSTLSSQRRSPLLIRKRPAIPH